MPFTSKDRHDRGSLAAACPDTREASGERLYKNVIGPQVRRIRYQLRLKQKDLAAKLQRAGWWIDRAGVSKIESGLVRVSDYRQLYLARVLRVSVLELLPVIDPKKPIDCAVKSLMMRRR